MSLTSGENPTGFCTIVTELHRNVNLLFFLYQVRELTRVQLLALGSSSVTLVICLRKSDSCMPGWEPRRLNWARGLARITCRFTAKPTERERSGSVWIQCTW